MATKEVTFTPQWRKDALRRAIGYANDGLKQLQSFVVAHGETWPDVLEYVKLGAEHKKQARLAEIREWMDKTKTPLYVRKTMEAEAVADLGADNLKYWTSLGALLRVRTDNYGGAPALNLSTDVDASGEVWRVSDAWIQTQEAEAVMTMPDWMVSDMAQFQTIVKSIADLGGKGYDLGEMCDYLSQSAYNGNVGADVDPEVWFDTYNGKLDQRRVSAEIE